MQLLTQNIKRENEDAMIGFCHKLRWLGWRAERWCGAGGESDGSAGRLKLWAGGEGAGTRDLYCLCGYKQIGLKKKTTLGSF